MTNEQPARTCGPCTLCCKLMGVSEIEKPRGLWCDNCTPGAGCKIYENRPVGCQEFRCMWLMGLGQDDMRPDRSKVILRPTTDGEGLILDVDPTRPNAWRDPRFKRVVDLYLDDGKPVVVAIGDRRIALSIGTADLKLIVDGKEQEAR